MYKTIENSSRSKSAIEIGKINIKNTNNENLVEDSPQKRIAPIEC